MRFRQVIDALNIPLMTGPNSRVDGVAPSRSVMVTVSELYFADASQTISNVEPAGTFWS